MSEWVANAMNNARRVAVTAIAAARRWTDVTCVIGPEKRGFPRNDPVWWPSDWTGNVV